MISRDDLATFDGVLVVGTSRGRLEILSPTVDAHPRGEQTRVVHAGPILYQQITVIAAGGSVKV